MKKSGKLSLVDEILKEHSKSNTTRVAKLLDNDPVKFGMLMKVLFNDQAIDPARKAAWVMKECVESHPYLIAPYLPALVQYAGKKNQHQAIIRNSLAVLEKVEIPQKLEGMVVDLCFRIIGGQGESVAAKAYAMGVIEKLSKRYPVLLQELGILVSELYHHESSGFRARARKILQKSEYFQTGKI